MTPDTASAPPPETYTRPGHYVDSDAPAVRAFTEAALESLPPGAGQTAKAIRLFDAVRDGLRYDPYTYDLTPDAYRASAIAGQDAAFCVPKAILLAACLRAAGIPAALGFADVKNHLNTPKLAELMETDLFKFHGYVQVWLDGKSYKITPAFNMDLCDRFGVKPLVFDGTSDALFHEYDAGNRRHMEYLHDRGLYADFPAEEFLTMFHKTYPRLAALSQRGHDVGDTGFGHDPQD
ncbi:MAG: transglutaminase family protein [Roseovarius sp.]